MSVVTLCVGSSIGGVLRGASLQLALKIWVCWWKDFFLLCLLFICSVDYCIHYLELAGILANYSPICGMYGCYSETLDAVHIVEPGS